MEQTVEKKVAETLLQDVVKVTVNGKEYDIAPPSIATLVLVSGLVSLLPERNLNGNNIVQECLSLGRYGDILAEIGAVVILGARFIKDEEKSRQNANRGWISRMFGKKSKTLSTKERLTAEIAETMSPSKLQTLFAMVFGKMEMADFFALTTFLTEVNLLKKTKVEN